MKPKHTPGPWKMHRLDAISAINIIGGGKMVCHVSTKQEANARLISAAPDLLHELKHMIQLILDHCDDLQGTPLPVALANATTLIQQTEGR